MIERGDMSVEDIEDEEPRTPMTPLPNPSKRTKPTGSRWDAFSFDKVAIMEKPSSSMDMRLELEAIRVPFGFAEPLNTDVLEYWRNKEVKDDFKKIIPLALGAAASQVTVERAFSILKIILNDRNTKLTDDYVEKFSLLKLNKKWLDGEEQRLSDIK